MTEQERIAKAGLTLVGPIVDGRFAVVSDGDFRVCRFDKKSRHGIRIGKTFVRSLDEIPAELQPRGRVQALPEPEPEPEPETLQEAPQRPNDTPAATRVAATAEKPLASPAMPVGDKLTCRGAIRAWLRNTQWRVGSHMVQGESFLVSRPDQKTFGGRRWHVATLRAGVVTLGAESLSSRDAAKALLGNAPIKLRLDNMPCHPARID